LAKKTQGTQLYVADPATDTLITVGCVTNITGITATRDQIETTCLDSTARTYVAGLAAPGAATFTINFDPTDASHTRLHELYVSGDTLEFALGWSDGTAAPTVDTNGTFNLPTTRTWIAFDGFITDLPFDFALNTVVTSNVSVQVSGFPTLTEKV
jgi:hypothetical protein